jgi:hypothetical protein
MVVILAALAAPLTVALPVVINGGQKTSHAAEQLDFVAESDANMYNVRPEESVRNVPNLPLCVSMTTLAGALVAGFAAEVAAAVVGAVDVVAAVVAPPVALLAAPVFDELEHAATRTLAAANVRPSRRPFVTG